MSLKDDMANDVDTVFFDMDEFAEKALYNGIEITVIPEIGEGSSVRTKPNDRERTYEDAIFSVRKADIPNPYVGDTIIYKEKEYDFAAISGDSAGMFRLRFIANESAVMFGGR